MNSPFYEHGSRRVLTADAFQFVLESELKRAVRTQTYLTLVVVELRREWDEVWVAADDGTVQRLAEMVGDSVRATDLVSRTASGRMSVALLDTDFDGSCTVVDRVLCQFDSYEFGTPLSIIVGAACYPTHALDADSLGQEALSRPLVNRRLGLEHSTKADL